jgi:DNA polymerase III subunit epsilon
MKLAITDIETTGLNPDLHEIIEIAAVLFDPSNPAAKPQTFEIKVKPEFPENGDARAYEVNGYNAEEWKDAVSLDEAMRQYAAFTAGYTFCAHNVTFDWGFINAAVQRTAVDLSMGYQRLDSLSMAWFKLSPKGLKRFSLKAVCEFLSIPPEPDQHRALNGAMSAYRVIKKLMLS